MKPDRLNTHSIVLIIAVLSFFRIQSSAEENPFMLMAGKKYADYSIDLFNAYGRFIKLDTASARKVIGQIEEVAKKTGSWEWKLEAEYFEMELFDIKRTLYGDGLFPVQVLVQKAQALLDQTQKWKVLPLELAVRQRISEFYWNYLKNYEWAFELYNVQEKRLQNVSLENIPEILDFYMKIATAHYFFADYPKAASLFKIVLEGADNSRTRFSQQHARNGLGLINRIYDDLDRSDSCFLAMIASCNLVQDGAFFTDNWNGMAEGNLGHNLLLRGAFDQAIPLLKSSIEKMVKWEDYAFAAGSVLDLANIWLQKGMLPQSKQSIDLALDYYHRIPREGLLSQIYETLNKYYAAVGKGKLSMAYMDSTQAENKKHQARFSALQLMRVAQRQHLSEQKLKEEQLIAAKIKSDGFKRSLMISCIALVLIGSVLVRYFMLYRKKQEAYKVLVRKSQEWAQADTIIVTDPLEIVREEKQNEGPDEPDLWLMSEVDRLMSKEKLYKDPALSVETLSKKIGAKRHNVSMAINHCQNKSFNTFVNEYRIKEAIKLLSKPNIAMSTIDAVAAESGFNDRYNFYRVFKKMTGLSPTDFRRNVH